jgi:hypothetical protein
MALKEAFAPEVVAPDFPLGTGGTSRSTSEKLLCHIF